MYVGLAMPKTIKTTTLRENLAGAIKQTKIDRVLVITKNRLAVSALVDIDYLEDLLSAANPKVVASIKEARASKRRYTHQEVFGELL